MSNPFPRCAPRSSAWRSAAPAPGVGAHEHADEVEGSAAPGELPFQRSARAGRCGKTADAAKSGQPWRRRERGSRDSLSREGNPGRRRAVRLACVRAARRGDGCQAAGDLWSAALRGERPALALRSQCPWISPASTFSSTSSMRPRPTLIAPSRSNSLITRLTTSRAVPSSLASSSWVLAITGTCCPS